MKARFAFLGLVLAFALPMFAQEVHTVGDMYDYKDSHKRCVMMSDNTERCLGQDDIPVVKAKEVMGKSYWGFLVTDTLLTAYDIEGTQHCIHEGTCREGNPFLSGRRYQAYPVGMGLSVGIPALYLFYWHRWDKQYDHLGFKKNHVGYYAIGLVEPTTHLIFGTLGWTHKK